MIRVARLLPLSLGVLLACDGAATTSPSLTADAAVLNDVVAELQGIDVQPLGYLDKAVVNTATNQPVTVAVMNYPDFFTDADLNTVTFFGASPMHVERIENNPECHITEVTVYTDADGNVVEGVTYTANLLHFELALGSYEDGAVVPMCLEGEWVAGGTFQWCADVTVQNRGGGNQAGNGPGR